MLKSNRVWLGLAITAIAIITAIVVIAVAIPLHAGRAAIPLDAADLPELSLEETCRVSWFTADGSTAATEQRWVSDSGALIHVTVARFASATDARAACEYGASITAIAPSLDPDLPGDASWRWPTRPDGARWLFQYGRTAVSLHAVGPTQGIEPTLERIANLLVARIED